MTRRRARVQPQPPVEDQLEAVRRTRQVLQTLSTPALYRIHDLLERLLAEPDLDTKLLNELEQLLADNRY